MRMFDHAYWKALYDQNIDPWNFRSSPYERAKYARTMAALGNQSFRRGLELGCSIGVLTRQLAQRCDYLVAVDTSERALQEARKTCPDNHVEFRQVHLPRGDLGERYDLIVASEILYYLDAFALTTLAGRMKSIAEPGALFLSVHWTGTTNYPLSGDDATKICFDAGSITWIQSSTESEYRLDVGRFVHNTH